MNRTTALLVIDAQTGIIEGMTDHPVSGKEKLVQTIRSLIDQARTKSIPVLYVQDLDAADTLRAEQIIAHHNTCLHGLSNLDPFVVVRPAQEEVFVPSHDAYREAAAL